MFIHVHQLFLESSFEITNLHLFSIIDSRLFGSPTKKIEPSIPEEAESETGSHLNVNGVISEN